MSVHGGWVMALLPPESLAPTALPVPPLPVVLPIEAEPAIDAALPATAVIGTPLLPAAAPITVGLAPPCSLLGGDKSPLLQEGSAIATAAPTKAKEMNRRKF